VTKACTSIAMESSSSVRRTLRNCLSWKKHLAQTASMCCSSYKSGVMRTPRTRVTLETLIFIFRVLRGRGGATLLRVGGTTLRAKRAENFFGVVPPTYAILGGTTATERSIRRAYRTALPQYLTGSARGILASSLFKYFYRAMHYSAKRSIAIACRPSVRPSVTLVDQDNINWRSWNLIARKISPTPSLFVAQRPSPYSQGNMGKFGETRGGVGKNGVLEHKSGNMAVSLKRVKIEEKLLWRAYRNSPTLFRTVPDSLRPLSQFKKIVGLQPAQNSNRCYLRNG